MFQFLKLGVTPRFFMICTYLELGGERIATGYLRIEVFQGNHAIANAMIRIYKKQSDEIVYEDFFMSDETGCTMNIPLYAPDPSLNKECPYERYHIEIRKNKFQTQCIMGVQIVAGEYSYVSCFMLPNRSENLSICNIDVIPEHSMRKASDNHRSIMSLLPMEIPENIIVHLGNPDDHGVENISIPFLSYLKNCASSELYPSSHYEVQKANVLSLMSFALHRMQTKWYPNKGYSFDITNTPDYDQAFVKNRNIFESIADIVDEVYAECMTMKNNSNNGKHEEIKRLKQDERMHPEVRLMIGSKGDDVLHIQTQLRKIANAYKSISNTELDGMYNDQTRQSVISFQTMLGIDESGVMDTCTKDLLERISSELNYGCC